MFNKGKVNRFNEAKENTPGTPSNNVKSRLKAFVENRNKCKTPLQDKNKAKPGAINSATKTETKTNDKVQEKENKNTEKVKYGHNDCKSEKGSINSEFGSIRNTPLFRTPSLMKYKKLSLASTPKSKNNTSPKKNQDIEALKEKIVECENKDSFIKDLSDQLEDVKIKMKALEEQKEQLHREKDTFEQEIESMRSKHTEELVNMTISFEMEMAEINIRKHKLEEELDRTKQEYEEFVKLSGKQTADMKENFQQMNDAIETAKSHYTEVIEFKEKEMQDIKGELSALKKNRAEVQEKHALEIENLKREYRKEIEDLEFELLKTMTDLQKEKENTVCKVNEIEAKMRREIMENQEAYSAEKQNFFSEADQRIKQVQANLTFVNVEESQIQEKFNHIELEWKQKLEKQEKDYTAILNECQAISEFSIIQCEVEKNKYKSALEDRTIELEGLKVIYDKAIKEYDDMNSKYKTLQYEMSAVVIELNDTRKNLQEELQKKLCAIENLTKDKITYELTIKTLQSTIEALTKRLMHSDKDVEQLKKELQQNEARVLNYEQKYLLLEQELKDAKNDIEDLDMQYESAITLNSTEIDKLGLSLLKKLEEYRKEGASISKQLQEAKAIKEDAMQQLHNAFKTVNQLKLDLDCLETINSQYEFEIEQSQNELDDYHLREMEWSNTKEKLEETIAEMEKLLEEKQCEVDYLKKQSLGKKETELNKDNNDYYENKLKEYETEMSDMRHINRKYIEVSSKYDELAEKFEHLEMENAEHKNKIASLSDELRYKTILEDQNCSQKDAYDELLRKFQNLQKEGNSYKVKESEILAGHDSEKEMLKNRIQHMENSLKDVSQKYAELLGHKKSKQKKKHLVELKSENDELLQNNMDLDVKLNSHLKVIETLKRENNDLRKCLKKSKFISEDKENLGSPNRSLNSSRIDSPFRDRN